MTVQAAQAGDVNYNAAAVVSLSFTVTPGSQAITFDAPAPTPTYGDAAFQVTATGGASGNPVTFTGSGACSVSSQPGVATITIVSAGACTVTASQAGNATYSAAPQASEVITISKATPSLAGLVSPTIEAGTATTTLGGSIGLGVLVPTGSVTVTLNGVARSAAIQPNGSFGSAFATGLLPPTATPYEIAYTYAGDGNFNGAGGVGTLTVVDTTAPAITVPANITATATTPSGAVVTFSASATDLVDGARPTVCSPASGSTFAIGTTTVTCIASDTRSNSASRSFTVTVNTAPQAGRMTGNGSITAGSLTHAFDFLVQERGNGADLSAISYRRTTARPGPDQVDTFVAVAISGVTFFNVPGVSPGSQPGSGVDTVTFTGNGLWNGRAGYTFAAQATDAGEPGRGHDVFAITVRDSSGATVASVNATITDGNIQSLKQPH